MLSSFSRFGLNPCSPERHQVTQPITVTSVVIFDVIDWTESFTRRQSEGLTNSSDERCYPALYFSRVCKWQATDSARRCTL